MLQIAELDNFQIVVFQVILSENITFFSVIKYKSGIDIFQITKKGSTCKNIWDFLPEQKLSFFMKHIFSNDSKILN